MFLTRANCTWCNNKTDHLRLNSDGDLVCETCLHINCGYGEPCDDCKRKDAAFAAMVEDDQHRKTAAMLNKSHLRTARNVLLNTVAAFVVGIMFVMPWIFDQAEVVENTQKFWMMVFGGN